MPSMTIDEVTARTELRALVDRYSLALDVRDAAMYAATFTPDGEITQLDPGGSEPTFLLKGTEQLMTALNSERHYAGVFHAVHNHNVEFSGDGRAATGITYVTVHHLIESDGRASGSDVVLVMLHDDYVLTDDGWRFQRRRIEQQWTETVPAHRQGFGHTFD